MIYKTLITLLFLLPVANFSYLYMYIAFLFCFSILVASGKINFSQILTSSIIVCLLGIYSSAISIHHSDLGSLKEFLKILLVYSLFWSSYNLSISYKDLSSAIKIYVYIDCLVSLLQFIHFETAMMNLISSNYHTYNHASTALTLGSVRALGLQPSPGQHGVVSLLLFIFFIVRVFNEKTYLSDKLALICALFSLILSQSKTSYAAFLVVLVYFVLLTIAYGGWRKKSIVILGMFFSVLFVYFNWEKIVDSLYSLNRLSNWLNGGPIITSLAHRFELWHQQIEAYLALPILSLVFGPGRSYLSSAGIYNNSFDNDFIYILTTFGLLGVSLLIFSLVISFYLTTFKYKSLSTLELQFYFIMIGSIFCGTALDTISDVKVLTLLSILMSVMMSENRTLSRSTNKNVRSTRW